MVEYLPYTFNIFISYSCKDEIQSSIFENLCEYYDNHDSIKIIDVCEKNDNNSDNFLCDSILSHIKSCDLFICLLTPLLEEENTYKLNYNVILELGTALSNIDIQNVCIFIEDDENKKQIYDKIKPSMISHLRYNTYINDENNCEDLISHILENFDKWDKQQNSFSNINNEIKTDNILQSIIKREMINLMFNLSDENINKMEEYVTLYKTSNIINLYVSFMWDNIPIYTKKNFKLMNSFFYILCNEILDFDYSWISNKNNQINIINLFSVIQYQLFEKYKIIKTTIINKTRRNFGIASFELIKCHNVTCHDEIKNIIDKSLNNTIYDNYIQFIIRLNSLNNDVVFKTYLEIKRPKEYYEDLILNSRTQYNTYIL